MMAPDLYARSIQDSSTGGRFNLREKKMAGPSQSSRLCFCLIHTMLLGGLVSAGALAAQEPPKESATQDSGILLRQTVRRVRVDVVVIDAQGHPVKGLQASDFRVAEDGKPQSIRQFEYRSDENAETTLPKRPPLPPHTFMNLPAAPEHGPLTLLLFDALNTPISSQLQARAQMLEFVKKSSGRRIAVLFLGDRLRILQGFTSDTDLLVQAVNQTCASSLKGYEAELTGYPTSPAADPGPPTDGTNSPEGPPRGAYSGMTDAQAFEKRSAEMMESARAEYASESLKKRVETTLDALVEIGGFLKGLSGRKNLIWYSGSFPAGILPDSAKEAASFQLGSLERDDSAVTYTERIRKATNLLNTAEISIYPIDARGLSTEPLFDSADNSLVESFNHNPPTPQQWAQNTWNIQNGFGQALDAGIGTMNFLAEQTGGHAFYNTNALEEALEKASTEGSSYYSMVYAPTNMKYDGSVRRISVHLEHGQYQLAYRRSYIADEDSSAAHKHSAYQNAASSDQAPATMDSMAAASQFGAPLSHQLVFAAHVDAYGAPVPATAEQMAALAPYSEQVAKAEHRKFVQSATPVPMRQYVIEYAVLASQMELPKSANGFYQSDLSMAALAFNKDGDTLVGTKMRLKDDIPASKIENIRKDGFQAIQTFFVPAETAAIRLVVRDEHSGQIGSMEIRLPLPPGQQKGAGAQ